MEYNRIWLSYLWFKFVWFYVKKKELIVVYFFDMYYFNIWSISKMSIFKYYVFCEIYLMFKKVYDNNNKNNLIGIMYVKYILKRSILFM